MKINSNFLKIVFIYFYMYFIGPLIWGIWMVFKLRIITVQECFHCLFSPLAGGIFISYFLFNLMYTKRLFKIAGKTSGSYYLSALRVHCFSLISFGTICTFSCMAMLSTNKLSFFKIAPDPWLLKAIIGSLSGASLVFLFFILFSVLIFTYLQDADKAIMVKLKFFNHILYRVGMLLFVGTAMVAFVLYNKNVGTTIVGKDVIVYLVSLALPILMGGIMYSKSKKKINSSIF